MCRNSNIICFRKQNELTNTISLRLLFCKKKNRCGLFKFINRAQIKSPHFFNIPQIKVWLHCGYKIDIDIQRDPFSSWSYWYQNFQSIFVDNDIWNRFLKLTGRFRLFWHFAHYYAGIESHLAEQLRFV